MAVAPPEPVRERVPERPPRPPAAAEIAHRLAWYRHGRGDPTTRLGATTMARAMWTVDGPATAVAEWSAGAVSARAWGPGAERAVAALRSMAAADRDVPPVPDVHPVVSAAARRHPRLWAGASGDLYHELLPTIVEQRITSGQAVRQWSALCAALGERPPGPDVGLVLPPRPERLVRPAWWFHPLGIEAKRARALVAVARVAPHLWSWAQLPPVRAAAKLRLVAGVGAWTIGSVLGPACGDDDAVPVGDYHLPNLVAWNLAAEARADDHRMLALLAPFPGQRGRVIRLLASTGRRAPAFGPRQRILPMHRW